MNWKFLKANFLEKETEESNYISYLPKDGFMIRMRSDYDNEWYTATYFQIILTDYTSCIVVQLEGLPENPFSWTFRNDIDYPVKIYKEVTEV